MCISVLKLDNEQFFYIKISFEEYKNRKGNLTPAGKMINLLSSFSQEIAERSKAKCAKRSFASK